MAITSADIQQASFSIDRKGYNVDEVDVFLERIAGEVDGMNRQIADLQSDLDESRDQLAKQTQHNADLAQQIQTQAQAAPASAPAAGETRLMPAVADAQSASYAAQPQQQAQAPAASDSAQVGDLKRRIAELEAKLAEKSANDTAISQALIVAQRSADDIVAKAKKEASDIIKDAEQESDRIINKAEGERRKINDAISQLEDEREEVRNGYRDMLSDFVADAQHRIASIADDERRTVPSRQQAPASTTSAMERPVADAQPMGAVAVQPQAPLTGATTGYPAPTQSADAGAAPAPVVPDSSYVEKDLSGFGDADNDFDFTDPD